jgi:hypothetical protein
MPVMTAAAMVAIAPIKAILVSFLGLSSANFDASPGWRLLRKNRS